MPGFTDHFTPIFTVIHKNAVVHDGETPTVSDPRFIIAGPTADEHGKPLGQSPMLFSNYQNAANFLKQVPLPDVIVAVFNGNAHLRQVLQWYIDQGCEWAAFDRGTDHATRSRISEFIDDIDGRQ